MSFSSPPGGAAPGAPKQGDISESRLEGTFPGLLRFTGVGTDSRVPSSLCKEPFAAAPGSVEDDSLRLIETSTAASRRKKIKGQVCGKYSGLVLISSMRVLVRCRPF